MLKRCFDIAFSLVILILFSVIILISWVVASIDTRANGFYRQKRIGRGGQIFKIIKLRSMRKSLRIGTTVTAKNDPRITSFGSLLRRSKVDELPQFWNVLVGDMSVVGPRPDVPGFADILTGEDRVVLSVKPGITGPAQIYFKNEEEVLAQTTEPEKYNRDVIWPKKVELNREYAVSNNFWIDLKYIFKTVFS